MINNILYFHAILTSCLTLANATILEAAIVAINGYIWGILLRHLISLVIGLIVTNICNIFI